MLSLWRPFGSLLGSDSFYDDYLPKRYGETGWSPRVDIKEDEKGFTVMTELPGLNQKDVSVEVKDGILTISGEKKFGGEEKGERYYRVERCYGSFSRSFTLSDRVDENGIEATFKDGLLTLTLPKKEEAKPKQIKVKN